MVAPKLRFRRDDGSEYPEWEEKRLGSICATFSGGTPKAGNDVYYNGTINFIRSGEIHLDQTELKISEAGFNNSAAKMVHKGDLLLALYGATAGEADISKVDGAINQAILCIRPFGGYVPEFICKHLQNARTAIRKTYLQGGQGNLSADIVKGLFFDFPCLEEQQKIANFLSNIDAVISASEAEVTALEQQKKGAMQKIFSQEIRFKRDGGSEYPDWEEKKFSELLRSFPNKRYQVQTNAYNPEGLYPIVDQSQSLIAGYCDDTDKVCSEVPAVVFGDHTTVLKYIDFPFVVGADGVKTLHVIDPTASKYTFYWLCYNNVHPTGYNRHFSSLKEVVAFSSVCLEEQQKIADFLSSFDAAITLARQELEHWMLLKKGLMQQMFV